jgi:hypothetical protein
LINQRSAGTYAGDVGERTNFGFSVKFNKQLTNLQGHANIIIRQDGHVYQVKTNATTSLTVNQVSTGVYDATFTSKANLTDLTNPLTPVSLGGNLDLVVTLRDAGEPGTSDQIGITLWRGNTLLYSSNWTGTQTVKQALGGGNLQVRKSAALVAADGAQIAEQAAALAAADFRIVDLDGATLGRTEGRSILFDGSAAGHGWFIDATPQDHAEFHFARGLSQWVADGQSLAFGQIDLLTTVMHELSHVLGLDDQQVLRPTTATLMTETLSTGVRRLPLTESLLEEQPVLSPRHQPVPGAEEFSVKEPLGRSLNTVAGLWGNNGVGGIATTNSLSPPVMRPVIDWTEGDLYGEQKTTGAIGMSSEKASWLQRFLLHAGRADTTPHDHGIEIVLAKKK